MKQFSGTKKKSNTLIMIGIIALVAVALVVAAILVNRAELQRQYEELYAQKPETMTGTWLVQGADGNMAYYAMAEDGNYQCLSFASEDGAPSSGTYSYADGMLALDGGEAKEMQFNLFTSGNDGSAMGGYIVAADATDENGEYVESYDIWMLQSEEVESFEAAIEEVAENVEETVEETAEEAATEAATEAAAQ